MQLLYMCLLFFNIFFPQKNKLSRGDGGFIIFVENPEGRGVPFSWKYRKSGDVGGSLVNLPLRWGYGYFLELHI